MRAAWASAILLCANVASADDCLGVSCSRHGECLLEAGVPLCLCDEGFAADGLRCVRVRRRREPDRSAQNASRVLYVAGSQANRGWQQVGGFDGHPDELSRYVVPGQMWCSEFISWVYASAGVPFTGGYDGGWLITNNRAIRRWFQRRSLWVAAGTRQWQTFEPQPGDYVRMHTRRGHGHSGIVRYVIGSTLYTVEGNVGNRVRLRTHRNYRSDRRFDGFGIMMSPERRRLQIDRGLPNVVLPRARETRVDLLAGRGVRNDRLPPEPQPHPRARAGDGRRRVGPARVVRRVPHHDARRRAGRREPRA